MFTWIKNLFKKEKTFHERRMNYIQDVLNPNEIDDIYFSAGYVWLTKETSCIKSSIGCEENPEIMLALWDRFCDHKLGGIILNHILGND